MLRDKDGSRDQRDVFQDAEKDSNSTEDSENVLEEDVQEDTDSIRESRDVWREDVQNPTNGQRRRDV